MLSFIFQDNNVSKWRDECMVAVQCLKIKYSIIVIL